MFKVKEGKLVLNIVYKVNGEMVCWDSKGSKLAIVTENRRNCEVRVFNV